MIYSSLLWRFNISLSRRIVSEDTKLARRKSRRVRINDEEAQKLCSLSGANVEVVLSKRCLTTSCGVALLWETSSLSERVIHILVALASETTSPPRAPVPRPRARRSVAAPCRLIPRTRFDLLDGCHHVTRTRRVSNELNSTSCG